MSIIIDQEFKNLIPPLSKDEYTQLERNIAKDGIRDALIVWPQANGDNILIDGHNRFNISSAHAGIRFEIKPMNFKDRDEARRWIARNQLGRRNLDKWQKFDLYKVLEDSEKKSAKERQGTRTDIVPNLAPSDTGKTRDKIASLIGVSHGTFDKMKTIEKSGNEEIKQAVRSGEISINQGYRQVTADRTPKPLTVRQKKQEELHEAKERHKDFQEKKSNSVVDIQDIKQDKEDRKTIARDLYHDLLSITTKSYWIGALNNSADFYALTEVIPEDMRASMADRVSKMIIVLNKLLEVIK